MVTYIKDLQHRITSKLDSLEIEAANDPSSFPSASSATAGSSSSNSSSSTSLLSSLVPSSSPPSFSDAPTTSPTTTTIPQFIHDSWERPNQGGQGISCVLNSGRIIEKGGVNISIVHGLLPPPAIAQMRANHPSSLGSFSPSDSVPYSVCGLSLVIHPRNPNAPTVHMNVRYFELWDPKDLSKPLTFWYGGGADLTPSYLYEEDGRHFHGTLKAACDGHGEGYYPAFKEWCDKYFYLPHRQQMRGIGGIFFDDLEPTSPIHKTASPARFGGGEGEARKPRQEELFEFVKSCGDAMLPAYVPVLEKRAKMEWTEEMRRWQLLRRGLYAEYNLVQDRGTKVRCSLFLSSSLSFPLHLDTHTD
jgi:coproporphyrinogen III oxidase